MFRPTLNKNVKFVRSRVEVFYLQRKCVFEPRGYCSGNILGHIFKSRNSVACFCCGPSRSEDSAQLSRLCCFISETSLTALLETSAFRLPFFITNTDFNQKTCNLHQLCTKNNNLNRIRFAFTFRALC